MTISKGELLKDEEILKKAVLKAIKNGYGPSTKGWGKVEEYEYEAMAIGTLMAYRHGKFNPINWYYPIIFDKDFAKAFWGEKEVCKDCGDKIDKHGNCGSPLCSEFPQTEVAWQHHLKQMVLEENPITYLSKFL